MNHRIFSSAALLVASLTLTAPAFAQEPTPATPSVSGASDRSVFVGGRAVEIDATAPDIFGAGESVTMRGEVLDNFIGAGRDVTIKGPVGGDAFLAGESLLISANVGGDVYAVGETLTIPEGVTVGGNLYVGAATLDLDGAIGGNILGGAATIKLDGSVGGDVEIEVADLLVGPGASIGGTLQYEAPKRGSVSDQATTGAVTWTEKQVNVDDGSDDGGGVGEHLSWHLFMFLASLLIGGVLMTLFPRAVVKSAEVLDDEAPVSLGIGFAILLGVPVLAVFLALFVLPIPLSLLTLALYVPATFLARYIAAFAVGKLVLDRMGRDSKPLGMLFAGLAVLHIGYAIPWIGGLVTLAATVLGLGALFLAARRAADQQTA